LHDSALRLGRFLAKSQAPEPKDQGNSKLKSFFEWEAVWIRRGLAQTPLQILRNARPQAMVEHFVPWQRRTPKGFARHGGQAEQALRRLDEKVIIAFESGMDWDLR